MKGFFDNLDALIEKANSNTVHEIGCGEGHVSARLAAKGYTVLGTDFSTSIIETAKKQQDFDTLNFQVASIYDLVPEKHSAPLILCCEVLEHLENPLQALEVIASLDFDTLILSVPREPLWSAMNMARGKYWSDFGNTPGHLQKWSKRAFLKTVGKFFDIQEIKTPIPWTMVLCKKRH